MLRHSINALIFCSLLRLICFDDKNYRYRVYSMCMCYTFVMYNCVWKLQHIYRH